MLLPNTIRPTRLAAHIFQEDSTKERQLIRSEEETPVSPEIADFFAKHIVESANDNSARAANFHSPNANHFYEACQLIRDNDTQLLQASKNMADQLFRYIRDDKRISPGNLFVFLCESESLYNGLVAIFKMDTVTAFSCKAVLKGGKTVVELQPSGRVIPEASIQSTQARRQLQKCAIVLPDAAAEEHKFRLKVIDYQVSGVSSFWSEKFLQCEYLVSSTAATEILYKQTKRWANKRAAKLPPEQISRLSHRVRDGIRGTTSVNVREVSRAIKDEDLQKDFLDDLKKAGVYDFEFIPDSELGKKLTEKVIYLAENDIEVTGPSKSVKALITVDKKNPDTQGRFKVIIRTNRWDERLP